MILLLIAVAWIALGTVAAFLVGAVVRLADRRAAATDHLLGLPAELTVEHVVGGNVVSGNVAQPQH